MKGITNFQYVGYLGDFLNTYNSIDELTEQFQLSKENYDAAKNKLSEYKQTFCLRNCVIGFFVIYILLLILTSPIFFLPTATVLYWLVICAIPAFVIILVSKIIYRNRVLPTHQAVLEDEINRAQTLYSKTYEMLLIHRSNLNELRDGIEAPCTYPLSIYIMREAAKEGECSNIPQGIRYFNERYKTLELADDEESIQLKQHIDQEQAASDARQTLLYELDDMARTLFDNAE